MKTNSDIIICFKVQKKKKNKNSNYFYNVDFVYFKNDYENQYEFYLSFEDANIILVSKNNLLVDSFYSIQENSFSLSKTESSFSNGFDDNTKIVTIFERPTKIKDVDTLLLSSDLFLPFEEFLLKTVDTKVYNKKEVRVYNVLQGNMNTIHYNLNNNEPDSDEDIILYDWGTDVSSRLVGSPKNLCLKKISTIFISHFHLDHYSEVVNNTFSGLKNFVVPNGVVPHAINRFLKRHGKINRYYLPLAPSRQILYHGVYRDLKIFTGPKTKSNPNNEGIILNIDNTQEVLSLTGDIYWYLFAKSLNSIKIRKNVKLVCPHHGGNIGLRRMKIGHNIDLVIFSFGVPNKYGHPSSLTKKMISTYTSNHLETDALLLFDYYVL